MQSAIIPRQLCDEIDRKCRDFLWGDSENSKHLHSVSWANVCKPKKWGGLGLRSARNINSASLYKVGYELVAKKEELWVQVVRSKYKCGRDILPRIDRDKPGSNLWRGIVSAWDGVRKNFVWRVGQGHSINCWRDVWIPELGKLEDKVVAPLSILESNLVVANLLNSHGEWSIDKIKHLLPLDICNRILSRAPPRRDIPLDCVVWSRAKDGIFSTASAYETMLDLREEDENPLFSLIWKWQGPERIRIYLWKLSRDALITNFFRFRRGFSQSALCPICNNEEETTLHMVRDCREVVQVWSILSENSLPQAFFNCNLKEWLALNLKSKRTLRGSSWRMLFGAASSCIWQARNERVFQGKCTSAREISVKAFYHAVAFNQSIIDNKQVSFPTSRNSLGQACWSAPDPGVVKLNCDGAVGCLGEIAAAGGILRDHLGGFILGFASGLGECSVVEAEIHAIQMGIKLANLKRIRKMIIETDSLDAVRLIKEGCSSLHPLFSLISDVQDMLRSDQELSLNHIFREANSVADCFAKSGLMLDKCSKLFCSIPVFAVNAVRADASGFVIPGRL